MRRALANLSCSQATSAVGSQVDQLVFNSCPPLCQTAADYCRCSAQCTCSSCTASKQQPDKPFKQPKAHNLPSTAKQRQPLSVFQYIGNGIAPVPGQPKRASHCDVSAMALWPGQVSQTACKITWPSMHLRLSWALSDSQIAWQPPIMAARRLRQEPEPFEAEFDEDEFEYGEHEDLTEYQDYEFDEYEYPVGEADDEDTESKEVEDEGENEEKPQQIGSKQHQ